MGKAPRRLNDIVDPELFPRERRRIFFRSHLNPLRTDAKGVSLRLNSIFSRELPMDRIVLKKIGEIVQRSKVVDRHKLEVFMLKQRTGNKPANPAKPIDCDSLARHQKTSRRLLIFHPQSTEKRKRSKEKTL